MYLYYEIYILKIFELWWLNKKQKHILPNSGLHARKWNITLNTGIIHSVKLNMDGWETTKKIWQSLRAFLWVSLRR